MSILLSVSAVFIAIGIIVFYFAIEYIYKKVGHKKNKK
jgi:hypothetical protein